MGLCYLEIAEQRGGTLAISKNQRTILLVSNVTTRAKKWRVLYEGLDRGAVRVGRRILKDHYRSVLSLTGDSVTSDGFVTKVRVMAKTVGTQALDVFLNVHGRPDKLVFLDREIPITELADQVADLNLGHRLRLMYSTACYGGMHAKHWVAAGFRTASGAVGVNTNGEVEFPVLLHKWANGGSYASAVRAGRSSPAVSARTDSARITTRVGRSSWIQARNCRSVSSGVGLR